jgi:drug/metabolite transporter (DMT)-like permease
MLLGRPRVILMVTATLCAFAGNSLLCRQALGGGHMDPAAFTLVRIGSGAMVLLLLVRGRVGPGAKSAAGVARAASLFAYAALFSWAYVRVSAAVGALVLFACVQLAMLGWAVRSGAGPRPLQWAGAALAFGGLVALTWPGIDHPDLPGVLLMAGSGIAWGAYSLLGRTARSPAPATAAAFAGALPLAAVMALLAALFGALHADAVGWTCALASGAVTSALGYVLWYSALPALGAARAAVVQLAVPVLTALGGVALLGERVGLRLVIASAAILGGIALAMRTAGESRRAATNGRGAPARAQNPPYDSPASPGAPPRP